MSAIDVGLGRLLWIHDALILIFRTKIHHSSDMDVIPGGMMKLMQSLDVVTN